MIRRRLFSVVLALTLAVTAAYGTMVMQSGARYIAPLEEGGDVTASWVVEYVNTSGVVTRTDITSGSTSITGIAPFCVQYDGTASRSVRTDADTEDEAALNLGGYVHHDEATLSAWTWAGAHSTLDPDEEYGPFVFNWCYEEIKSHTVTLRLKDMGDSQATTTLTVVTTDPLSQTTTNITATTGAWPTLSNSNTYTLARGSDYTARGVLNTAGLHNVTIVATGSGADPIIAGFKPEPGELLDTAPPYTRAKNVRLWNIDTAYMTAGPRGWDYSGAVGGRVRSVRADSTNFWYGAADTANERANVRAARGYALWRTGKNRTTDNGCDSEYNIISDGIRGLMAKGVDFEKDNPATYCSSGGSYEHIIRGLYTYATIKNSHLWTSDGTVTYLKTNPASADTRTAWQTDDTLGDTSGTAYGLDVKYFVIQNNQMGDASDSSEGGISLAPQNDDDPPGDEGVWNSYAEDNHWYQSSSVTIGLDMGGKNVGVRGNKYSNGAGGGITYGSDSRYLAKIPSGYDGPYMREGTNTRPLPTVGP